MKSTVYLLQFHLLYNQWPACRKAVFGSTGAEIVRSVADPESSKQNLRASPVLRVGLREKPAERTGHEYELRHTSARLSCSCDNGALRKHMSYSSIHERAKADDRCGACQLPREVIYYLDCCVFSCVSCSLQICVSWPSSDLGKEPRTQKNRFLVMIAARRTCKCDVHTFGDELPYSLLLLASPAQTNNTGLQTTPVTPNRILSASPPANPAGNLLGAGRRSPAADGLGAVARPSFRVTTVLFFFFGNFDAQQFRCWLVDRMSHVRNNMRLVKNLNQCWPGGPGVAHTDRSMRLALSRGAPLPNVKALPAAPPTCKRCKCSKWKATSSEDRP